MYLHVPTPYEATFFFLISPKYTAHSLPVQGAEASPAANHKLVLTVFTKQCNCPAQALLKPCYYKGTVWFRPCWHCHIYTSTHSVGGTAAEKVLYLQTWTVPYPTPWCGRVRVVSLWASSPRLRAVDGTAAVCLQSPPRTGLGLPLHPSAPVPGEMLHAATKAAQGNEISCSHCWHWRPGLMGFLPGTSAH